MMEFFKYVEVKYMETNVLKDGKKWKYIIVRILHYTLYLT